MECHYARVRRLNTRDFAFRDRWHAMPECDKSSGGTVSACATASAYNRDRLFWRVNTSAAFRLVARLGHCLTICANRPVSSLFCPRRFLFRRRVQWQCYAETDFADISRRRCFPNGFVCNFRWKFMDDFKPRNTSNYLIPFPIIQIFTTDFYQYFTAT